MDPATSWLTATNLLLGVSNFTFPGVLTTEPDQYVCTAINVPFDEAFIRSIKIKVTPQIHHIVLKGCKSMTPVGRETVMQTHQGYDLKGLLF